MDLPEFKFSAYANLGYSLFCLFAIDSSYCRLKTRCFGIAGVPPLTRTVQRTADLPLIIALNDGINPLCRFLKTEAGRQATPPSLRY